MEQFYVPKYGYLLNILPTDEKTRSGERTRESLVLFLEDKTKLRLNEWQP